MRVNVTSDSAVCQLTQHRCFMLSNLQQKLAVCTQMFNSITAELLLGQMEHRIHTHAHTHACRHTRTNSCIVTVRTGTKVP